MSDETNGNLSENPVKVEPPLKEKKRLPVPLKILSVLGMLILLLVIILAAGFAFSHFDRERTISFIPEKFSVYLHADSAWDAAVPLLDLKALDQVLSTPEYSSARNTVMNLRSSGLKDNKLLKILCSRKLDAALYMKEGNAPSYLCVLDLGFLSLASRTLRFYYPLLKQKDLNYDKEKNLFTFQAGEKIFYIAVAKNLVLASESYELLSSSLSKENADYTEEQLQVLVSKSDEPVKIVVSAGELLELFSSNEPVMRKLSTVVSPDTLCTVNFKITNDEIDADIKLPLSGEGAEGAILQNVFNKDSTLPLLLSRLNENVQYYTILNSASLEELKNDIFPLMAEKADMESVWNTGNGFSQSLFHVSLEDLLFSWTGNEFAVLGIENHNDPVFVLQVKDEKQRQKVFDSVISSIIINSNDSLILDGVRLPRLELPKFLQSILKLFDISLPAPYYLVRDGFICFSENPEALSAIYKSTGKLNKLSSDESWISVSKKQTPESTISLFYDLNRSVPFFLRSKAAIAKVLSLYSIGRMDFCIEDYTLDLHLSAVSKPRPDEKNISGFPISLEGKNDGILELSKEIVKSKNRKLFWVENRHVIHSMEIPSMKMETLDALEDCFICADKSPDKHGLLWTVTETGSISLLDEKFENANGFPVLSGMNVENAPVPVKDGIVVVSEDGKVVFVNTKGKTTEIFLPVNGSLRSGPYVWTDKDGNEICCFYDKSFIGQLLFTVNREFVESMTISVPGIAYGIPSLTEDGMGNLIAGFITQDGSFSQYIFRMEDILNHNAQTPDEEHTMTVQMEEGTFNVNAVTDGVFFYVLSTDAVLSRISRTGEVISVKLPYVTARDGLVQVIDGNIFVSPDGNLIYGFDQNLELLLSFPLEGRGTPVFSDINGDRKNDFFSLSIDNKLNAWNVRF